jgi:hypothetical protein
LRRHRCGISECQNRKSITEYVGNIQTAVQACGFRDEYTTVCFAWKQINIALREYIPEPPKDMTVERFIAELLRYQSN